MKLSLETYPKNLTVSVMIDELVPNLHAYVSSIPASKLIQDHFQNRKQKAGIDPSHGSWEDITSDYQKVTI